ncbi:MAG: TonB-dependent receptor [Gammaproteobacteria bacterium]|nr:TonB-dependent receptor [Gammaproteobacteria bacterium]MBU2677822.1 TonB-dependent receptor [Gammaproteobacteria bacterium]NNC58322.1 TonB-dependent receptor [Woeseiaceae bacterium]NNL51555.1 TonB-dependent receptor [Woeseiaceae bacterium]
MDCCKKTTSRAVATALALAALSVTGSAFAQIVLEEITVTATKRESTIQDVPFSINAQTAQDIQRSGATDLEGLARNVAGLTVQNLGPGQSQVAIRGVSAGQIVRDQPGVKEQVGVYLDESVISLSLFTPDFDLYDLNRVETLRGPQGTLFGSGSVGGTIRYITNKPDLDAFDANVELDVNSITDGDVGGHVKGMVNIPLVEGRSALRLVGYTTEYGGFIDARLEGGGVKSDVNGGNRMGARAALTFMASDTVSITPRIVYQEVEADGFNRQEVFNLYANPYTTTRPAIQLGEREQFLQLSEEFTDETLLADVTMTAEFENFDLDVVVSTMDREILVSRDASALTGSVSVDLGYPDAGVLLPSNLRDTTDLQQTTFEARLASTMDGPFQWLVGVFVSDAERKYAQRLPTPGYAAVTDATLGAGTSAAVANGYANLDSPYNADLPYDIEQMAFFGEATYDVSDTFHVTVGGRFYDFDESRTITQGGLFSSGFDNVVDTTSSDGFTPRILASWNMNDNVTLNAQASQGFRLGGVNDPLNATLCSDEDELIFGGFQSYSDEKMWNYEAGMKSTFANGVTFNAAAFYSDIEDLQVTLDAGSCSSRISFNVADAHTAGVEFELGAQPSDALYLSLAGSILQSEFDSTVTDANGAILGGVQDGNRLASVPDFQIAASGSYNYPLEIFGGSEGFVTATIHHVGDRITQPSDQNSGAGVFSSGLPFGGATGAEVTTLDLLLDPYTIINLSAGIEKDDWSAVLYIRNVGDENADLSFDRERGGRARLAFRTNSPRTIGVTFRKSFSN